MGRGAITRRSCEPRTATRASLELDTLLDASRVYSYGADFRYLLARKMGLGAGIDVARGPEETVGYLTIGSTW